MTPEFIETARFIGEKYGKGEPGESWFFVFSPTGKHLFNVPGVDKDHARGRARWFWSEISDGDIREVDRLEKITSLDTSIEELFNPVADPDFVRNMKAPPPPRMKPRPITSRMEPRPITRVQSKGGFFD